MNLSPLIDFIENVLPITGDSIIDSILFFVIGVIAFRTAWFVGGQIKCDSTLMSIVHWLVRIVGTLILWALVVGFYWLIKLIASIPWWVWIVIVVVGVHIIVGIVLLNKYIKKKKRLKQPQKEEEDE